MKTRHATFRAPIIINSSFVVNRETMKTMRPTFLAEIRAKWLLLVLILAAALFLFYPQQDALAAGQAPVYLGSADSFAVLAGTQVTSTNGGTINGDVGVWPGTNFVVGVPPVIVNGTKHLGDPVAARAQADLTTAYNNAAGRATFFGRSAVQRRLE